MVKIRAGAWDRLLDSADTRWNGPDARAPGELTGSGGARIVLAPLSVAVYAFRIEPITNR
ncbi:MAG TPA: hypothetical protein VGE74_11305 [Gemmata sp.]